MADNNQAAETVDTAAQTTETAPAPAQAGKAGDEKVNLDRLIEEEGYAEQILAEKSGQQPADPDTFQPVSEPSQSAAPAAAAKAEEQTLVIKDGENEERIPISQAQNRLNQAKHLQRIYQTEIAPLAKVVRDSPVLADALQSAMRGDRTKLDAMLAQAAAAKPEVVAPTAAEEERIAKIAEALVGKKEFAGWKPEELKANLAAIAAMQSALQVPSPPGGDQARLEEQFQQESQAIASESVRLKTMLSLANPSEHDATMNAVGELVKGLYGQVQAGKVSEQDFLYTMSLYNDPRNLDEQGKPMFLNLYRAAQEYRRTQGGKGTPAPAMNRGGVNARIAPGAARAAGAPTSGALPNLNGKSREERIALMDSFLGV